MGGLAGAALLAFPYALNASRVRSPLGPETVQRASLILPVPGEEGRSIGMDLWFPASGPAVAGEELTGCGGLLGLPLADKEPRSLLLYMAHFKGTRNDNASRMEVLASHGYIIAALDDIGADHDGLAASAAEAASWVHEWPTQMLPEFEEVVGYRMIRAGMAARKGLHALDSLAACAASDPASPWSKAVDYEQVGFMGFSFGGAAASEAAALDPRIAAVANIDGSLYGRSFFEGFDAPNLYLLNDEPLKGPDDFGSRDSFAKLKARFKARDLQQIAELAARPGSGGYRINGTEHASFTEALFDAHASRRWLFNDPIASFDTTNAYLLDFFDMHLRGTTPQLIGQPTTDNPKVDSFAELGLVPGGDFGWPDAGKGPAAQD